MHRHASSHPKAARYHSVMEEKNVFMLYLQIQVLNLTKTTKETFKIPTMTSCKATTVHMELHY